MIGRRHKLTADELQEPVRRLSLVRVFLALVLLVGVGFGGYYGFKQWRSEQPAASHKPWFAAYVDVTATPSFAFQQVGGSSKRDVILSFVVASPTDPCTPAWGAAYTLDQARASLDLDRRIARLQEQGGSVAVSFGGRDNQELATVCTDQTKLVAAYQAVIDRYNLDTIDLDLENVGLTDATAASRRAAALATLQSARRSQNHSLAIWVTLPVSPQGLTLDGTNAVSALLDKGVDLAGINIMTMDYGQSLPAGQSMAAASESALTETVRQLGILYQRAGVHLNAATIWSKMGATPMIGQNDDANEVFSLTDAADLNQFAVNHHIGRMSMWSANRDLACGSNYVYVKVVSTSCSGVSQNAGSFADTLGSGFSGSISLSASLTTKADPTSKTSQEPDDPKTSPYQIWSPSGAYLQGTKVVWHHNVYQAKWWTQGDTPDNPVLQSWETPWQLVGPVLAGEKPIPQPKLPKGTYPEWSGRAAYNAGQRVLFNGTPYQAKWWTQGDSPAASSSDPDGSAWTPLTQAQVNLILQNASSH